MNSSKCARVSQVMQNMKSGKYQKQFKFANFGSIPEDSIYYHTRLAEQAETKKKEVVVRRQLRVAKA
jgi:hypothetical protein